MTRRLASVETIVDVRPIAGADAIEAVTVRGWTLVTRRGEFTPGALAVFFEVDCFLPVEDPRFAFLAPRGTKVFDGRTGHVLKTAKLRGVYSQGLALPVAQFPELADPEALRDAGEDVAARLGVVKWEAPVPAQLAGVALGPFPTQFAPKTDAERVQNLVAVYDDLCARAAWVATEKIDGTSVTFVRDAGQLRVCSRNLELVPAGTTQARLAESLKLLDALEDGDVVQGELFGEGIQANPLKIRGQRLAIFAVLRDRRPLPRAAWPASLAAHAAPVFDDLRLPASVPEAIAQADGIGSKVTPGQLAEGVVWHAADGATFDALDGRGCFKVISNKWLLKHDR